MNFDEALSDAARYQSLPDVRGIGTKPATVLLESRIDGGDDAGGDATAGATYRIIYRSAGIALRMASMIMAARHRHRVAFMP